MEQKKTGTFINGREQAQEILRMLTPNERTRILQNINLRNPSLANELKQNSISLRDIESFGATDFKNIFQHVRPEILGLALKQTSKNFQREILKIAPRQYAEKAFETLMMQIPASKMDTIKRAKKLILSHLSQ